MSPYQVEMSPSAEDQLAAIWVTAPDRDAVTRAQDEIDLQLASSPHQSGQHRHEGLWRIVVPPLAEFFEIDDQRAVVRVTDVFQVSLP